MVERDVARAQGGVGSPVEFGAIERRDMAWPPASWEREAGAWRDDVWTGPEPFEPQSPAPHVLAIPPPTTDLAPDEPAAGSRSLAREGLEIGLMALLLFGAIRFVSQNYVIERESMQPTLHSGDMVLVNKLGYRLGFGPVRGDVVVFHAWPQAGEKDFVKRVVGVPGDSVSVREGHVEIDGVPVEEPYLIGAETTPDSGPIVLGPDDYYVMGDNRSNSVDSRAYGPLPRDRIVGKAWITYWPLAAMGAISDGDPLDSGTDGMPGNASNPFGDAATEDARP